MRSNCQEVSTISPFTSRRSRSRNFEPSQEPVCFQKAHAKASRCQDLARIRSLAAFAIRSCFSLSGSGMFAALSISLNGFPARALTFSAAYASSSSSVPAKKAVFGIAFSTT